VKRPDRGGPPERIGVEAAKLLDGLLRTGEARLGRAVAEAWTRAVGERAARFVRPIRLAGGVLQARAASPVWRNEIRMQAAAIVERLRRDLGDAVREIDIRVGTVADAREADAPGGIVAREPLPGLASVAERLESDDLRRMASDLAHGSASRPPKRRAGGT